MRQQFEPAPRVRLESSQGVLQTEATLSTLLPNLSVPTGAMLWLLVFAR
jgi:hypothetical protein